MRIFGVALWDSVRVALVGLFLASSVVCTESAASRLPEGFPSQEVVRKKCSKIISIAAWDRMWENKPPVVLALDSYEGTLIQYAMEQSWTRGLSGFGRKVFFKSAPGPALGIWWVAREPGITAQDITSVEFKDQAYSAALGTSCYAVLTRKGYSYVSLTRSTKDYPNHIVVDDVLFNP